MERVRLKYFRLRMTDRLMVWCRGTRYTENYITDTEFSALPPRLQEQVKRVAQNNQSNPAWPGTMFYNTPQPNRYKRVGKHQLRSDSCSHVPYGLYRLAQGQDLL